MMYGCTRVDTNSVTNSAVLVVGHSCYLMALRAWTTGATETFIQLFDAASAAAVTLGTTVPSWVVDIPAGSANGSVSVGDGLPSLGLKLELGLVVAATSGTQNSSAGLTATVRSAIM